MNDGDVLESHSPGGAWYGIPRRPVTTLLGVEAKTKGAAGVDGALGGYIMMVHAMMVHAMMERLMLSVRRMTVVGGAVCAATRRGACWAGHWIGRRLGDW